MIQRLCRRAVTLSFLSLATAGIALFAVSGCGDSGSNPPQSSTGPTSSEALTENKPKPPAGAIEIVFPYGSEKKLWLNDVTDAFNAKKVKTSSGKPIHVKALAMGSGELTTEVLEERLKAHIVSPASMAFIKLGNAESQAKLGKPYVGKTQELVLSPVIIAMWKPMAEAIGWGKKPVGWSDILELARSEEGWAKYNYPQWGRFKFGHTHPEYSNSGIISLFAETYAATGKTTGLTLEDVQKSETAKFLREIERSVVHYGSSTGFFGRKLFGNGPEYLSAAVLYENMVIESYNRQKYPDLPFPVVAIYPKEGTFWSDHPVGVVQRDWVTAEHKEAAETYIDYLLEQPQQAKALQYGFRPADLTVPMTAPLDTAHGVNPDEPKTTLEVPSVDVMDAIKQLWKREKKHANIVLVLDTSGSMKGARIRNAKVGAKELINMLGEKDTLSFMPFSSKPNWLHKNLSMKTGRDTALKSVDSLIAGGGTAMYDSIADAHAALSANPKPDRITAIVVLTDGADQNSKLKLNQLLTKIRFDNENRAIRVFTIGYGAKAQADVLGNIADQTQARFYKGTTENIREVFKEISTFF